MTDYAFLHGGGQGGWVWDETLAALGLQAGAGVRCLALDGPGCGAKRGRDTAGMSCRDIAVELVEEVEAAGLREVILVGHSQAGKLLPLMAELRPELWRRLVFVTCIAPPPGRTTLELMGEGQHGESDTEVGWPVDPETTSMEERLRAMFCNDMGPAEADAFFAKLGQDMWPACCYTERDWRYDHLADVPSTFVLCLRDQSLPPPWQERFAERFRADRIVRIDAGHQVMNTRPHSLAEVLRAEA